MRTMTATEASRAFAALLDEVERGETVVITRGGRRVAEIAPATQGNGRLLIDFIRNEDVEIEYERDVNDARELARFGWTTWPDD